MKNLFRKILVLVAYVVMVGVNFLANYLPINNRSTGEISADYANLFTPAGYVFSIWGLIYFLLGCYVVLVLWKMKEEEGSLLYRSSLWFVATCLANVAWIFAWHYDWIAVSVVIMIVFLGLLKKITGIIRGYDFDKVEQFCVSLPFNIYFGWINVALIANITVWLVSLNWGGFGLEGYVWTIIVLIAGAIIGLYNFLKHNNIAYILVFVWAYIGILFQHVSVDVYNSEYPSVVLTLVVALSLFTVVIAKQVYLKKVIV